MSGKNNKFFTITTPRKDGAILEQFLDEFGYTAFEKEDRSEDTRRSVSQVTPNEELIMEVSDFCKDNRCTMQLIYKRGSQLVQQTFQSEKAFKPKTYGTSSGQELKEIEGCIKNNNVEQKIQKSLTTETVQEFLKKVLEPKKNQSQSKSPQNSKNQKKTTLKKTNNKNKIKSSLSLEKELPKVDVTFQRKPPIKVSDISVTTRKRKF